MGNRLFEFSIYQLQTITVSRMKYSLLFQSTPFVMSASPHMSSMKRASWRQALALGSRCSEELVPEVEPLRPSCCLLGLRCMSEAAPAAVMCRQSSQNCRAGETDGFWGTGEILHGALTKGSAFSGGRRDWSDWEERPVSAVCLFCEKQAETTEQLCAHMEVRRSFHPVLLRGEATTPRPRQVTPLFLPLQSKQGSRRQASPSYPWPSAHCPGGMGVGQGGDGPS